MFPWLFLLAHSQTVTAVVSDYYLTNNDSLINHKTTTEMVALSSTITQSKLHCLSQNLHTDIFNYLLYNQHLNSYKFTSFDKIPVSYTHLDVYKRQK